MVEMLANVAKRVGGSDNALLRKHDEVKNVLFVVVVSDVYKRQEQNAIIQAARYGINITGASIYVNTQPCVVCAKMLINAGIEEIVYQNPYPDELAMSMLEEAGMKLRVFEG